MSSSLKRTGFKQPTPGAPKVRMRKCVICKNPFPVRFDGFENWCSVECGAILGQKKLEAQKTKAALAERKQDKVKLEAMKPRVYWIKRAEKSFNLYIRLRAIRWGHTCISSGRPLQYGGTGGTGGWFDAGHYRSVGSAPHLRFNLNNVWGQSKHDNNHGSGAHTEYRKGLIAMRGLAVVEALEADTSTRKFTIEYLQRLKKIFDKKANRIKKIIDRLGLINE